MNGCLINYKPVVGLSWKKGRQQEAFKRSFQAIKVGIAKCVVERAFLRRRVLTYYAIML